MKKLVGSVAVAAAIALSGCASIVTGSKQEITIDSFPQGAEVIMKGVSVGVTPLTLKVDRDLEKVGTIEVKKDGYQDATVKLSDKINPWFWGNIVIGGLPGSSTDSTTGANKAYEPSQYMVNLEKAQ